MKIAVVGTGYSGIGIAHSLRNTIGRKPKCITVFDVGRPGTAGASAVSAGMLHPITPKGKMSWRGDDAFYESVSILSSAEKPGIKSHVARFDMPRPITQKWKVPLFEKAIEDFPEWVGNFDGNLSAHLGNSEFDGSFVAVLKQARVVDSLLYMRCFWDYFLYETSSEFVQRRIESPIELSSSFDLVFIAIGAGLVNLWGEELPLTLVRGRNIIFDDRDLSVSLEFGGFIHDKYIVRRPGSRELICGSSYEYAVDEDTTQFEGDIAGALQLFGEKIYQMMPELKQIVPTQCAVGIRVSTVNTKNRPHVPLIMQHSKYRNCYAVTGMGSKGLLYHGLVGRYAVMAALSGCMDEVPVELKLPGA